MDTKTTLSELKKNIQHFCEERDWGQFHGMKDLSIGLSTEAAELLELFRFKTDEQCEALLMGSGRQDIEDEIADVLFFILRIAQKYDIDLSNAFAHKMQKNAQKYPVEKSRGSNKKYTEL